ncbi:MAG: hypothetical protein WC831_03345 [Parcubacteria group bacterium]|jgi:hypothetical protein
MSRGFEIGGVVFYRGCQQIQDFFQELAEVFGVGCSKSFGECMAQNEDLLRAFLESFGFKGNHERTTFCEKSGCSLNGDCPATNWDKVKVWKIPPEARLNGGRSGSLLC